MSDITVLWNGSRLHPAGAFLFACGDDEWHGQPCRSLDALAMPERREVLRLAKTRGVELAARKANVHPCHIYMLQWQERHGAPES